MENERARLTKKLTDIYEGQGKIKEAAEILQELQVISHRFSVRKKQRLSFYPYSSG